MEQKPLLIEPGVKYFIGSTLKECRKFKDRHISMIFNISMTLLLLLVIITVAVIYNFPKLNLLAGYAAKNTVSSVFIGQRILMLMPRF